jgi:2-polyprenyl-3-methyl-5-hydroxy-6-metoxy-1,4-benzoquinol methylase/uncharacterized protein YbaR (Trm112 family)
LRSGSVQLPCFEGPPIMKIEILKLLCCPSCSGDLVLESVREDDKEVKTGTLRCVCCAAEFPIEKYVPRFVPAANYSANFGFQWKLFSQTQLDSHSGKSISRDRFFQATGWRPVELSGKIVLDAGCGSGRFAEVALDCGATVVAVDYSTAIDACRMNLGLHAQFNGIQADIRQLPFRKNCFDYVYSLGVLQHTPNPHSAFAALPQHLTAGGSIAIDIYRLSWKCLVRPKYWLRPVTTRLPATVLFNLVKKIVPKLLPLSRSVARLPKVGGHLRHLIPVANYEGILPLAEEQLVEWAVLDTFDMLSPAYDRPKTINTVRRWFEDAGLQDVTTSASFVVVGQGRKPQGFLPHSC